MVSLARSATSLLALFTGGVAADKYAVLVAGSSGYSNYRHQADIAHAYTILAAGNVPPENIITMMYDDIAHNLQNKFKGQLFNRPDSKSGTPPPDVYAAVKDHIDYRKGRVTPANFLKVLTGDSSANGRVLTSGPEDDVFVYFADHGGVGILAFPNAVGIIPQVLHADKLHKALQQMAEKRMFKRLVFYTEACESGSVFDGLLEPSLGIYAVTAANPRESSWGWYCGGDATGGNKVHGKEFGPCLGDEFSVRWMEDTDHADESKETLDAQFSTVQGAVTKSHVQRYGNLSFVRSPLDVFFGDANHTATPEPHTPLPMVDGAHAVDSRDAQLHYLQWRLRQLENVDGATADEIAAAQRAVEEEVSARRAATTLFMAVWARVSGLDDRQFHEMYLAPRRFECHREVIASVPLQYTDFSLKYHRVVVNLCEMGFAPGNITAAFHAATAPSA